MGFARRVSVFVSIPRSEFWSFGLDEVGDLGTLLVKFQFLGRNSGRSDVGPRAHTDRLLDAVSIPRSEFWSFGPALRPTLPRYLEGFNSSVGILVVRTPVIIAPSEYVSVVSIPRSEFWSFGRNRHSPARHPRHRSFNSSVGILVVRTKEFEVRSVSLRRRFNSSVGILVVRTFAPSSR